MALAPVQPSKSSKAPNASSAVTQGPVYIPPGGGYQIPVNQSTKSVLGANTSPTTQPNQSSYSSPVQSFGNNTQPPPAIDQGQIDSAYNGSYDYLNQAESALRA